MLFQKSLWISSWDDYAPDSLSPLWIWENLIGGLMGKGVGQISRLRLCIWEQAWELSRSKPDKTLNPITGKWFYLNLAGFKLFQSLGTHFLLVKMKPNRAGIKIAKEID